MAAGDTERVIGQLLANQQALEKQHLQLLTDLRDSNEEASKKRAEMHNKLNEITISFKTVTQSHEHRLANLEGHNREFVDPAIKSWMSARYKIAAALSLMPIFLILFGAWVRTFFDKFTGPPGGP